MNGSYFDSFLKHDLYGKLIPGMIYAFFIFLVLPVPSVTPARDVVDFSFIFFLTVLIITIGFGLGLALNTFGVVAEKVIFYTGGILRTKSPFSRLPRRTWFYEKGGIYAFCYRRYKNIKMIFMPHRQIFRRSILDYLEYRYHREEGNEREANQLAKDIRPDLIGQFLNRYRQYADASMPEIPGRGPRDEIDISSDMYPMLASLLETRGDGRWRRFRSRYMLSRGLAIVFFIFSIVSVLLTLGAYPLESHVPVVISALGLDRDETTTFFSIVTLAFLVGTVNFMYSSGEYKYYFVEYFIADFSVAFRGGD